MRTVTRQVFERRCREGVWEAETDVNRFGRVQVRECCTGKRYTVKVED
jgi:hypothetical protein